MGTSGEEPSFQAEGTESVKALSPGGPWRLPHPTGSLRIQRGERHRSQDPLVMVLGPWPTWPCTSEPGSPSRRRRTVQGTQGGAPGTQLPAPPNLHSGDKEAQVAGTPARTSETLPHEHQDSERS